MSQLKTIKDTSGFAAKAVEDLSAEGSTIAAFRFQARLGVGKHFTQFFWLLLPFYTNLKFWFYLLSIFIGFLCGEFFFSLCSSAGKGLQNVVDMLSWEQVQL